MDSVSIANIQADRRRALITALLDVNRISVRYGLTLSPEAAARLADRRTAALLDADRVELGRSVLGELVAAFCDSPYLLQEEYETVLGELTDAFYAYKTACRDLLSDEELLAAMRARFDEYEGGVEAVTGMPVAELCRCRWLEDEEEVDETDD